MPNDLAAVVLAGGLGTRMKSALPKHLHPLLGRRMVDWVIRAAHDAGVGRVVVVASPDTAALFDGVEVAVQLTPLGTGDAVRSARAALDGVQGDVVVLNGDVPALTPELVRALVEAHRAAGAAGTVLSFEPSDLRAYGRIVRDARGGLARIVEAGDASPEELALGEVNSGIYVFQAEKLWPLLERLEPHNSQGELYVTDTLGLLVGDGEAVAVHTAPVPFDVEGINTRVELAAVTAALRDRINERHMLAGVTIVDPASTWIEADVEIAADVTIQPFTVLRGATKIQTGAQVGPHVVAVDAEIGPGVTVGPFAYLRPGTVLGEGAKAGTFVELKKARIGARSKVPHLSYIGDAEIGEDTNIAAGNITANFPHEAGKPKGTTRIGSNVRTGVDNTFDAPVSIGDDAWIAAGSVIKEDVPPGSLAGFPPRQETKEGWVYEKYGKPDDAG
ncbi:MAG TPA: bifunctional UDP-N-acetylglucosamine diphosphorylase/glucosamine-1-phosphate N-acetyltransferase GlmU [Gaiellaceae bacterium]|nr:bifunctional UDP-N-acetylglucosamine diphosphorylase/glucosamine-1-phosphate N-acetyltransferase GlmU [Gaiellaceae bacterium]